MYCRRESRFVQNLDVRRQTGGPRGVTHQGNANANEPVFTRAVARGGIGGGWLTPPTFVELTYSENWVGHSENYGNNSITKC